MKRITFIVEWMVAENSLFCLLSSDHLVRFWISVSRLFSTANWGYDSMQA